MEDKEEEDRISPDDEGSISIAVTKDESQNCVIVQFGKPITWIGMDPHMALHLGSIIVGHAKSLLSKKKTGRSDLN
jgi:hypothetical protein